MFISSHKITVTILAIITLTLTATSDIKGKTVYAIPQHWGSGSAILNAYEILEDDTLEYQATYDLSRSGAGDVAIDTRSNILFITSEGQDDIELVNARTFLSEGFAEAEIGSNLAGIVLDYIGPNTVRVYTVNRGTNELFVYDWNADAKELTLLPYSPSQDWYTLLPQDPESDPNVTAWGLSITPPIALSFMGHIFILGLTHVG